MSFLQGLAAALAGAGQGASDQFLQQKMAQQKQQQEMADLIARMQLEQQFNMQDPMWQAKLAYQQRLARGGGGNGGGDGTPKGLDLINAKVNALLQLDIATGAVDPNDATGIAELRQDYMKNMMLKAPNQNEFLMKLIGQQNKGETPNLPILQTTPPPKKNITEDKKDLKTRLQEKYGL